MRTISLLSRIQMGLFVIAIVIATGSFGQAFAAEQSVEAEATPHPTNTEDGKKKALLIATLAEYGKENRDALSLLCAASILQSMEIGVTRRDGSHNLDDMDHGSSGLFTVEALVAEARELANDLSDDEAAEILAIADRLSGGYQQVHYQGYLHTHWAWWCGPPYFRPGICGYEWVSHY